MTSHETRWDGPVDGLCGPAAPADGPSGRRWRAPGMADKRNGSDRACRCRQAHVDCVGVVVQRLGEERVLELAEEIWTASGADLFRRQRGDNRTSASAR